MKLINNLILIIGIPAVIFYCTYENVLSSFQEQVVVYDSESDSDLEGFDYKSKKKGGNIKADVDYVFGSAGYEEVTTKGKYGGSSTRKEEYYIIPAYITGELCSVCVKVTQDSDKEKMEAIYNGDEEKITFTGSFRELDNYFYSNMKATMKKYNNYFIKTEGQGLYDSDEELEAHVIPLYLEQHNFGYRNKIIAFWVLVLVVDIFILVRKIRSGEMTK